VFNVGHEMVPLSRFVRAVGMVIGRNPRTLPPGIDRLMCMAIDRGFRAFTHAEMSPSLVRPARYPHDKARAAFGYNPQYSLLDGMAEIKRLYHAG
jgi:nucleoside-diphosphate-sugar epimerase